MRKFNYQMYRELTRKERLQTLVGNKMNRLLRLIGKVWKAVSPKTASKKYNKGRISVIHDLHDHGIMEGLAPTRIIFLDIDGPLVNLRGYLMDDTVDRNAVKLINRLCIETGSNLVISSTWRADGELEMSQSLKLMGFGFATMYYGGLNTEAEPSWRTRLSELTDDENTMMEIGRGLQIKEYLDKHPEVDSYIIIDDDEDMLEDQLDNFIHVDEVEGFGVRDFLAARAILRGENMFDIDALPFVKQGVTRNTISWDKWYAEQERLNSDTGIVLNKQEIEKRWRKAQLEAAASIEETNKG